MVEKDGTDKWVALRGRIAQLEKILDTSRELTPDLTLEPLLKKVLAAATELMGGQAASILLRETRTGELRFVTTSGEAPEKLVEIEVPVPVEDSIAGGILTSQEPLIVPDLRHDPRYYRAADQRSGPEARSLLGMPLIVHDRAIGVLAVDSTQPDYFTSDHVRLATAFAGQVAVALENARLYDEAQQRAAELETLRRTSLQLGSSLDLSAVLDSIAHGALALVGASDCLVYLYDEASESFIFGTALGRWAEAGSVLAPRHGGLTAAVAREGRPVVINDAVGHPLYASPEAQEWNIQAIAGFPLQQAGRFLGVLHVAFVEPHTFREEELRVLGLLADRAGIAIENARLFETERAQLEELIVLHAVATACAEAMSEDVLIERVVTIIGERLYPADVLGVMLLDKTANALHVHPSYFVAERIEHLWEAAQARLPSEDGIVMPIPVGQGISGVVAASGQPWRVGDVTHVPEYIDVGIGVRSELCVPLKVSERVIGVIDAESAQRDAFSEADERLLATVAGQLATAIEKVRLYEEAQQEIAERARVEDELRKHHDHLEELVKERTVALTEANAQLQQEITERVRADAELRRYQEHLEELVEERTAELRESEERYRTLFDGVPLGLYRTTPAGQTMDANPALVHMLGCPSREDLLAINWASVYLDPEDRVRWQALMEREGIVRDFEVQTRRHDGTVMWVNDTARAVRDEGGQVLYYEGSLEDITERKQAEEELRKYQEHLKELVEERTAELRESEERYRTLFDGVPVGLYRTTPVGQILDANLAMVQMAGYPDRETLLAANTATLYVDPEEQVRWRALMEREGVVRDFEGSFRRYDGTVAWFSENARAVRDKEDQVLYYEGSLEDITERKKFEEELRRQKEYYEALFVNSPVAVVTADLEGNVVSWNPMAEKLFGYAQEEAIDRNIDHLVADDDAIRAEAVGYTDQVIKTWGRIQATAKRTRKDGSLVDVELLALPMVLAGETVGFIAIYHDISERKRFEEELRRQKEYYEALFVNSPVAVVTADLEGNVVSWNPIAERLFGYTQEEVIGRNLDDLVAKDESIRAEAAGYTDQVIDLGRVQVTTKRTRKDGSLVDVEVLALPVIVAGDKVGSICIYVDIADLQEARRQAEAASQAKSAFLANMSHELRTPLNAILGFTQLMDRDPNLTAGQQENLAIINRSGEHLLALINDVLEMSKIEAGRVTLQETSFDLYRLLGGLEEMFRLRAEDKGLALHFERAENLPQYVRTDEGKLRQALSNLLGNAVKFTQEGGITLRVGTKEHPPSVRHSTLVFEVEDTGPGIAPEELAAVFDPFVQATSGQESQEGTGLGLSISRQYVRLMGGDIAVSSGLGQGSLFRFDVRVALADAVEVQEAQPRRRVLGLEPDQPVYRLLVAEDKETNRQLLVKLLEPLGFEVRQAVNGQEALEVWERWEPHLIWMDMRMPVMDGHEATRRIKATTKGQATVIVALTATAFEEDRERVLLEGCDDFVRKPFREDEIFDVLARHLGVRFVYAEEPAQATAAQPADAAARLTDVLTPAALAALPASWLADLQQATIKADLNLILTLVDQIRGANPALADALAGLADNFEYKKILTLIEQAGG